MPQLGGVQPVHAPRRLVVSAGQRVQIEHGGAVPRGNRVGRGVELSDACAQGPAERSRQPEDLAVVVVAGGEHGRTSGAQRADDLVVLGVQPDGIEVRAERVVHAHDDHGGLRLRRERARQLLLPHAGHPGTDGRQVGQRHRPRRSQSLGEQRAEAAPAAAGHRVPEADRGGVTEDHDAADQRGRLRGYLRERRDCDCHANTITRGNSSPVSAGCRVDDRGANARGRRAGVHRLDSTRSPVRRRRSHRDSTSTAEAATMMPAMLISSCRADSPALAYCPSTAATAA